MKKLSFAGIENSLSRDEMKKIMAGSGGTCYGVHHYCNGCQIIFSQYEHSWVYQICGDWCTKATGGCSPVYSGSGQYQGTFCGGSDPCHPS